MQEKFYFTRTKTEDRPHGLIDAMEEELTNCEYSDDPSALSDGTLYRVTIEKVGIVRTAKEVEFDTALAEESN